MIELSRLSIISPRVCFGFIILLIALAAPCVRGADPAPFRIAVVSDPHISDHPTQTAYAEHLVQVIREVNASHAQVVLMPGDLTQDGSAKQMAMFKKMIKGFNAKVWYVPGNHDVGNKEIPGKHTSLGDRRLKNYQDHIGPLYFSADVLPGLRVIGITSSLLGSGLKQEKQQWDFLSAQLPSKHGEMVVLFTHYPPFIKSMDEANEYFNMDQTPRKRLMDMLEKDHVRLILSGHLHRPIDRTSGNIHIIGAPAVSFGLPPNKQPEGWTLVTIAPDGQATAELHYLPQASPGKATH